MPIQLLQIPLSTILDSAFIGTQLHWAEYVGSALVIIGNLIISVYKAFYDEESKQTIEEELQEK
jgi:drug/metabolite transporter (DMT)-like permease